MSKSSRKPKDAQRKQQIPKQPNNPISHLPSQPFLRRRTSQPSAEVDILLTRSGVSLIGKLLLRRPDLLLGHFLTIVVLRDGIAAEFLEVQRALFEARVHLAVDEDAGVDVLLRVLTQVLVFGHDALVDLVDELEVFFARVFVAEDLVLHRGADGAVGDEALDHEEVGSVDIVSVIHLVEV